MVQRSGCRKARDPSHSPSGRDELSHAMSAMPSLLLEWEIDVLFQVTLGNDQEMRAFYVPELKSNALRVSGFKGDQSIVMSQLMKAATRAQAVCRIHVTERFYS